MGAGGALIAGIGVNTFGKNIGGPLDGTFKNELVISGLPRRKKVLWLGFKGHCVRGVRGALQRGALPRTRQIVGSQPRKWSVHSTISGLVFARAKHPAGSAGSAGSSVAAAKLTKTHDDLESTQSTKNNRTFDCTVWSKQRLAPRIQPCTENSQVSGRRWRHGLARK